MKKNKIVFIVGPTAVGKTEVGCLLAQKLKTEVVSCDAMQVYKEISILSGKASQEVLKKIKHHLINAISIKEDFDVFNFYQKTLRVINGFFKKGMTPVIVGGSGLYMSILLDGIFQEKSERDIALRKKIEKTIQEKGKSWAFEKVKKIDPKMVVKIHPNDVRRMVRVLEIYEIYKKPISDLHEKRQGLWGQHDVRVFALTRNREELYDSINRRVDQMFQEGAVQEIERLGRKKLSRTAQGIIGVKEIQAFLKGQETEEQTKYLIKRNTRRFAKRQMTWFRKDKRLTWIEIKTKDTAKKVAQIIFAEIKGKK
ncbi:MAG: tRNA (adenosine(37)-N6)-dimethylallyltransferase MiaA [Candidatus Aceula meridiana]|nr:tRNA (adenosine(37)-N6)-dimethylallyltransferase MiaA [Candidatus Aceula meridiana]